jgi:hypothetical protein
MRAIAHSPNNFWKRRECLGGCRDAPNHARCRRNSAGPVTCGVSVPPTRCAFLCHVRASIPCGCSIRTDESWRLLRREREPPAGIGCRGMASRRAARWSQESISSSCAPAASSGVGAWSSHIRERTTIAPPEICALRGRDIDPLSHPPKGVPQIESLAKAHGRMKTPPEYDFTVQGRSNRTCSL